MSSSTMPTSRGAPSADAAQLRALRAQLEDQRRFRTDQIAQLTSPHAISGADDAEREITESLLHGSRVALREIEAALERMDAGDYGRCTGCDEPIPLVQLEVLPQLSLCTECQRRS